MGPQCGPAPPVTRPCVRPTPRLLTLSPIGKYPRSLRRPLRECIVLRSAHRRDAVAEEVVVAAAALLPLPTHAPREQLRTHPLTQTQAAEVVAAAVDAAAPEACSPASTPCVSPSTARPTRSR